MTIIVLASARAAEGKTDELISALSKIAADSESKEKGTLQYQVSQGKDDPREIAIWEEYEDHDAHMAHREGDNFKAFKSQLDELLEGELKIQRFERKAGFK